MSKELQIFNNTEFGQVRTFKELDGTITFCGADTAKALGYSNPRDALIRHCKEDGVVFHDIIDSMGRKQEAKFITRGNLIRLISNSQLPAAGKFESWIFDEVVPSVLEHGAYMTPETLEAALLNPDTIIKIATALKEEKDKNKALQVVNSALTVDNQIMAPKADYFDELVDRNLLTNFRETAKQLAVKEKTFVSFLIDKKYVYRDKKGKLMPYAQYADSGLFQLKECINEKTGWGGIQTLITPKGRETFRLIFQGVA